MKHDNTYDFSLWPDPHVQLANKKEHKHEHCATFQQTPLLYVYVCSDSTWHQLILHGTNAWSVAVINMDASLLAPPGDCDATHLTNVSGATFTLTVEVTVMVPLGWGMWIVLEFNRGRCSGISHVTVGAGRPVAEQEMNESPLVLFVCVVRRLGSYSSMDQQQQQQWGQ